MTWLVLSSNYPLCLTSPHPCASPGSWSVPLPMIFQGFIKIIETFVKYTGIRKEHLFFKTSQEHICSHIAEYCEWPISVYWFQFRIIRKCKRNHQVLERVNQLDFNKDFMWFVNWLPSCSWKLRIFWFGFVSLCLSVSQSGNALSKVNRNRSIINVLSNTINLLNNGCGMHKCRQNRKKKDYIIISILVGVNMHEVLGTNKALGNFGSYLIVISASQSTDFTRLGIWSLHPTHDVKVRFELFRFQMWVGSYL